MSRRSAARDVATAGMMIAVIEALKLAMQGLPNIEMTSFLLILFTLHFGRLTLLNVPALILIEGTLYGFGLWWVMYLYAWPLLALLARLMPRSESAFPYAMLSGIFGLLATAADYTANESVSTTQAAKPSALASVSGRMPALIRFATWIRAKLLAMTHRTPRYMGTSAACSREEPWP